MAALQTTYAQIDKIEHRLKAVAALLDVSENTLRANLADSDIDVKRANQANPNAPAIRVFDIPTIFQIAGYRRTRKLTKTPEGKKPVIIAVQIIKGGTGKTTTAAEVSVQLQLKGFKVLAIDIDIQANLTQLMGYEADLTMDEAAQYNLSPEAIVKDTFATICKPLVERGSRASNSVAIIKYPFGPCGPALIPSDTFFGDLEHAIAQSTFKRELVFQKFFKESLLGNISGLNVGDFDVVVFDCPPNISFASTNAIACADIVIAPVKMDSFSMKGLSRLISEINTLYDAYNSEVLPPELVILPTYFSTNIKRVGRMQEKLAAYRNQLASQSISQSEEFPKYSDSYLPLTLIRPTSPAVKEYRMFVDELAKKIIEISKRLADQ
jgi:cellulose biosynthesis protein BcsQ